MVENYKNKVRLVKFKKIQINFQEAIHRILTL